MEKSDYLKKITSWDDADAIHILSRTQFGFTRDDVAFALSKTSVDDFVDNFLLADKSLPAPPQYNSTDWTTMPDNQTNQMSYTNWAYSLLYWWYNLMLGQNYSLREKMVLFFHNHFTTQYSTVRYPQLIYKQNQLFRQNAFGNLIDLTKQVTIDPAMLLYLNGAQSSKSAPNENYGRELMELFTLGIGNYTEDDIKQAARALTGWRVDLTKLSSSLNNNLFDNTSKTFLTKTGNWGYSDIVDIIFSHTDSSNNPVAAQFFCRKLYKEFAYYLPNEDYVKQLADVMVANNYNLKPVLSAMLKSQYFHSADIRGARIKPPVEYLLSALKQYAIPIDANNDILGYVRSTASSLQQTLFDPPDVRGWQGQRKWISTITYPTRNSFSDAIINGYKIGQTTLKVDVIKYVRSFPSSESAVDFINDVTKQLLQFPASDQRKQELLSIMLDGAAVYDWSTYDTAAAARLQKFFKALMRLPEFQLS